MAEKEKKPRSRKRSKLFPKGKERQKFSAGSCDGFRESAAGGLKLGVCGEGDGFPGGVEFASGTELAQLKRALGK